jgi:hypothetical protein
MALGSPYLTPAYGPALERALAETVPGTADAVCIDGLHTCSECRHWVASEGRKEAGYCTFFMRLMRLSKPGPKLRARQRARRKWLSEAPRLTRGVRP